MFHPHDPMTDTYVYYHCHDGTKDTYFWEKAPVPTPPKDGTNPEALVRTAIVSLGLHPPTVGVGAFVYPGYQEWGLTWWVGAPLWLWVDATDPLQWGTHTVTADDQGLSVTATITTTRVTFDPGDGSDPVTCWNPGTTRAWRPRELMSKHSPAECEYVYLHTNTLGDVASRYEVTATTTWVVTWSSTDGQYGEFSLDIPSIGSASIHVGEIRVVTVPNAEPTGR
jgi:hypothetical protein